MFALCIFVKHLSHIYETKIYLFLQTLVAALLTPSGGSALGEVVSETPLLFVQRFAQSPSGESCLCCIYGVLLGGDGYRFLNHCIECFYTLSVLL